ncbi:30S ribosome-binding factor [bacterium HR07]|uniref:Ribosome-binding factor A n=1 Tax=Acetithermum autotrophicum TaxID=1446466 RepID=H5SU29_ACEAU|nr:ribosome-binding factor A [Candidatus Acetothermum autotrophicum]GBC76183.1 30S ribosome-binding factor [bacterium HR07]
MSRWGFARLQEEIHHRLSEILQVEARDPRLERVTIFSVKLSKDVRHAWVYVGVLGDSQEDEVESLEALREHRGFLRAALARSLHIRHTPELHFQLDEATERARRIEELLEKEGKGPS